jgi:hypothetical protein
VTSLAAVLWLAGSVLIASALLCSLLGSLLRSPELECLQALLAAAGFGLWALSALLTRSWVLAVIFGAIAAVDALDWRNSRRGRRRRRALRAMGAKSAALLAGLCRKARESGRPRQVLRPAPGGAR